MTTKTTQELREAINQEISDLVDEAFVAGMLFQADRSEQETMDVKRTKQLVKDKLLSLIAKHEAELVENTKQEVLAGIKDHEIRTDDGGDYITDDTELMREELYQTVWEIMDDKLTALTEKESKE